MNLITMVSEANTLSPISGTNPIILFIMLVFSDFPVDLQ